MKRRVWRELDENRQNARGGFTLIEISIVLIIMGLLVGGVLSGKDLIRAAELRKIDTQYSSYTVAIHTFIDKFSGLPGDLRNATDYWGKDNASCPNDSGTASASGTCNGDSDTAIVSTVTGQATGKYDSNGAPIIATATVNEATQFWRQLGLAKLVEGTYSGVPINNAMLPGQNVPSSIRGAGWSAYTITGAPMGIETYGDTEMYNLDYGNVLEYGVSNGNKRMSGPTLNPREAQYIDEKYDDGKPGQGHVIARYWNNSCAAPNGNGAVATNTNVDASYIMSSQDVVCALIFRNAF